MPPFDSLEDELDGLQDFAYSGESRPFNWVMMEPPATATPLARLGKQDNQEEAFADLCICMSIYMTNRRKYYINYMESAKRLFSAFFDAEHLLTQMNPDWDDGEEKLWVSLRTPVQQDWSPAYELQRLWLITKIHWSWLALAWIRCEKAIWTNGQSWQQKKLERPRPSWRIENV